MSERRFASPGGGDSAPLGPMRGVVGVKYCGGCNPRYDRVALAGWLEAAFPALTFLPATPALRCHALLVFCGCGTRCADLSGLDGVPRCTLCRIEDCGQAAALLAALQAKE